MGTAERRDRDRAERRGRITAAAQAIAGREGWGAVTIRRLAQEIEYSQPVLYSHFENRDAIVAAVAIEGFRNLATALREAARRSADRRMALRDVANAYLAFTDEHPALYEAMFTAPTSLRFAQADTPAELKAAFAALAAVVSSPGIDSDVATETVWAALHGLATLDQSGRIRRSARDEHVALIVERFSVLD